MSQTEQLDATETGMTLRVYRLQEILRKLPLLPRTQGQHEARDRVSARLIRAARQDGCLPKINLMAGRIDV